MLYGIIGGSCSEKRGVSNRMFFGSKAGTADASCDETSFHDGVPAPMGVDTTHGREIHFSPHSEWRNEGRHFFSPGTQETPVILKALLLAATTSESEVE